MDNALAGLQRWYLAQCDGDWEHQFGVKIDTLDNPGWRVQIDLVGPDTNLGSLPVVSDYRTDHDWIACRVEDDVFKAAGGPENLEELLTYFLDRAAPA